MDFDQFSEFGVTREVQLCVTLFSLAFTLLYPLMRWAVIPAVKWTLKGRPRSELFLAIKKKLESSDRKWTFNPPGSLSKHMTFGFLSVNLNTTSDDWLEVKVQGKPSYYVGHLLVGKERSEIVKLCCKVREDMLEEDKKRLANVAAKELAPCVISFPHTISVNAVPLIFNQVDIEPPTPPVETVLPRQEIAQAAGDGADELKEINALIRKIADKPTPGMQAIAMTEGEWYKKVCELEAVVADKEQQIENWKRGWPEMQEAIKEQHELLKKSRLQVEENQKEAHELRKRISGLDNALQQARALLTNRDSQVDAFTRAITEADKTIKNQQDLIDRLNREAMAEKQVQLAFQPGEVKFTQEGESLLRQEMKKWTDGSTLLPKLVIPNQT